jgi:hypothetical protein
MGTTSSQFIGFKAPSAAEALSYSSATNSYSFVVPANIVTGPAPNYNGSTIFTAETQGQTSFREFQNQCDFTQGYGYSHSMRLLRQEPGAIPIGLAHSSIGSYVYSIFNEAFSYSDDYYFGIGARTPLTGQPVGIVRYNGKVIAKGVTRDLISRGNYAVIGDATIEVDFTTRAVQVDLVLRQESTTSYSLGSHRLVGQFTPAQSALTATNNGGRLAGFLSGPKAEEMVLSLDLQYPFKTEVGGYDVTMYLVGAAAAKR